MDKVGGSGEGCFLCDAFESNDDVARFVVFRGATGFVIMNAYPYNTGHVMVAPNRHVAGLSELDAAERGELMEVTNHTIEVISEVLNPEGFNTGMNLGRVGGAGVPGHLHMHVVPRWVGDTNFMPVIGETKVLPELLEETAAKLRTAFLG